MEHSPRTDDADTDPEAERRAVVVSAVIDNRWSWLAAVLSVACGVWVYRHASQLSGTGNFYMGLFGAIALLMLWFGMRDVRSRLKRLTYASD